jgi:DNA-binding winged helix-turn-helix (wHTH) protein
MDAAGPRPTATESVLRFGVFELDLAARELRKSGLRLRLQDQPFQVLAVLVEKKGAMVTREELRQQLWPADTFVDFDHGLNTAINKLRETLGDSAATPRFIETLPRKGYRFIYPVTSVTSAASGSEAQTIRLKTESLPPVSRRLAQVLFILLQLLICPFTLRRWRMVVSFHVSSKSSPA